MTPLTVGQEALWFSEQIAPGGAMYHVPLAFRLSGPLRPDLLARALNVVVRRHETLRTRFRDHDNVPYQEVLPVATVELPVREVCHFDAADREPAVEALLSELVRGGFDLAAGRVLRACLIRVAVDEAIFVVVVHHIATDGWSSSRLVEEISLGYRALLDGVDAALPELPVRFADYTEWYRQWMSGDTLSDRLAYWARHLADLPDLDLGAARPVRPRYSADRLVVELDRAVHASLLARPESLFSLLGTAFALVLRHASCRPDVAFGTVFAGRIEPELEPLVGYFVNVVPLRVSLADGSTLGSVARRLGAETLAALDHEVPFGLLVQHTAPRRVPGRNPFFQVCMQLRGGRAAPVLPDLPGVTATEIDICPGQHPFDLTVAFVESGARMMIHFEYSTELFDRAWAGRFVSRLDHALARVASTPDMSVAGALADLDNVGACR